MKKLKVMSLALILVVSACSKTLSSKSSDEVLQGLFKITAGKCSSAGVTEGSYFRMVQPGGKVGEGPFVSNTDSQCGDQTFTPMQPGSDGGLSTLKYQAHPSKPFDSSGNGAASAITLPTKWFGVAYSLTTNQTDPQTTTQTSVPKISLINGKLTGDLRAFAAAWNGQHFNQGSPKPDGSKPGNTAGPTGSYDAATKAFTLDWTSQIVGGPFNNFTGKWHLEGVFAPK